MKIQKQSSIDGAKEPEPENIESTFSVLKLAEGLRLTEDGFRLQTLILTKSDQQQLDKKLCVCFLSCCEEILKEKGRI